MINWLDVYGGFVSLLIRLDYSDAAIRTAWSGLQAYGIPPLDGPELGVG